ncbi:MAG: hypothetical protein HYY64_19855, partial [Candidatus Rokubacteria bacterium]|nr:hypothetical protein [Candidatus Rokubacteria bacterium]
MRRRGVLVLLASVLLLVLLVGAGLLYVRTRTARELVRAYVERSLARELNLAIRLGGVSVSLGMGGVQLKELAVGEGVGGEPLLRVERVRISLALLALLRGELRVGSVSIREPRLSVEDTPELRAMLAGVVGRLGRLSRPREAEGFPLRLEGGAVRYRDPSTGVALRMSGVRADLSWPSPERAAVALTADAIQAGVGERGLSGVRLDAHARVGRDVVEVERLRLDHGGSTLTLTGVILNPGGPPRVELTASGELALAELARAGGARTRWGGRLSVGGKLFGEGLPRTFEGRLGLADGTLTGVPARLVTATVLLRPDRVEVISASAQAGGGTLSGSGVFEREEARWRGSAQVNGVSLADLLGIAGWPSRLDGRVSGSFEGSGRGTAARELALELNLTARELRLPDGHRNAEGALRASSRQGMLRVKRAALHRGQSALAVAGTVDLRTGAVNLTTNATVADLAKDLWPAEIPGLGGRLTVSGRVSQTLKRPSFVGEVGLKNASFRGWRADSVEGPLEVNADRLASRGLRLSAARTTATVSGEGRLVESKRKWGSWREDLHLALKADLRGRLEDLVAWSQRDWPVGGPVLFQARLAGTPSALEGGGQVEMRELRIGAERLEALRAALLFKGAELGVRRLTARRGGVLIQAEGAIDTEGRYRFSLLPVKLGLATIPPVAATGARGTAVLRLKGAGTLPEPSVEGDVTLTDTAFREIETGDGKLGFSLEGGQWRWELGLALGLRARGV